MKDTEYKPYEPDKRYKVLLTTDEALLIQKIRQVSFGSVTVHLIGKKIVRVETVNSELTKDNKNDKITIALEVVDS